MEGCEGCHKRNELKFYQQTDLLFYLILSFEITHFFNIFDFMFTDFSLRFDILALNWINMEKYQMEKQIKSKLIFHFSSMFINDIFCYLLLNYQTLIL